MNPRRKRFALAAGAIASALFLALAFRGLQPEHFISSLRGLRLEWLALAVLTYFLAVVVIAKRWQYLLRGVQFVPLPALARLVFIGYMGNNVYPLRAGDALRIVLLRRNHKVRLIRSTTIVALERMLDGCVMLGFLLFSLPLLDIESPQAETLVRVTAPLFALALPLAALLALKPNLLRRVSRMALEALPSRLYAIAADSVEEIIIVFEGLRSPAHLLGAVLCSFITWGIEAATYWLVIFAFGLELNYAAALLLVGAVNLAGLIPAAPGQVGVNEFVVITILSALGVAAPAATAFAVVVRLTIWLPVTVAGFALLLRQGLGWADISRARDMQAETS